MYSNYCIQPSQDVKELLNSVCITLSTVVPLYRKDLDTDHYGLDKLKKRVIEYLAVRQLKNSLKGPILCFVGPPGVGKTSVGKSIAQTLGREFHRSEGLIIHYEIMKWFSCNCRKILDFEVLQTNIKFIFNRIALGGVCDQSDIRGHRRTYIGSMPGRIIQGLRLVGVNNPVFLLDEVDKLVKKNSSSFFLRDIATWILLT